MRCRLEVQPDPLLAPSPWNPNRGLTPDVAEEIANGGIRAQIVEAGWYGHLLGGGKRADKPTIGPTRALGIEAKVPQTVQVLTLPGGGVRRTKHR